MSCLTWLDGNFLAGRSLLFIIGIEAVKKDMVIANTREKAINGAEYRECIHVFDTKNLVKRLSCCYCCILDQMMFYAAITIDNLPA